MKMTARARSHAASELPLEELLALYGYEVLDPLLRSDKDTCQLAASLPDMTLDKITKDLFPEEEEEEESSADDLTPSVTSNTSELLRRLQGGDKGMLISSSSEEESDDDSNASSASNDGRKDIMVGSMYQAKIPPISPYTFQDRAQDVEDQLLWSPGVLSVQEVEEYLLCARLPGCQEGAARSTRLPGDTIRDNEQALYELVKCNFSVEEALRRLRFNVKVYREELCAWSEQECRNFEHGYRVYGKNFHLIQGNKVRTRSVGEVVEYYYMWKKSERHEYFTQQASKLTRRKYNMHMEDGDQDGEVGELVGGGNSQDSGSQGSLGAVQLESSSLPPQGMELDKQGGGPSQEETNTTLSLKAMNLVRTGLRKLACPVGRGCMLVGVPSSCSGAPSRFSRLWKTPGSLLGQAVVPSQTLSCRPSPPPLTAAPCNNPVVALHPPPRRTTVTSWALASTSSSSTGLSSQRALQGTVLLPRGVGMASLVVGCRWTSPCPPPPPLPRPLSCPQISEATVPFCAPLPCSAPTALSHSEEDTGRIVFHLKWSCTV